MTATPVLAKASRNSLIFLTLHPVLAILTKRIHGLLVPVLIGFVLVSEKEAQKGVGREAW